ncbi:hypothetical protein NBO_933g0001 [Nosema bombycis CQ1]|uniref:Uncharacterized protein n=1 Tax=Nosema bombycis (strain CQ1 / CVCC 102059) TaxID=578461 RepID=R0KNF6_NOSB1|nr:hypothetical protein NBO_933g0001 [Nosema bombycis CQ1]|eukprot:EOB11692.1 hypothetical protein NBO_933g0001 [Nosema bombycis CQ1]
MESQYDLLITDIKKYILIQGLYVNTRYPNFEISKILNKIKISEEDCTDYKHHHNNYHHNNHHYDNNNNMNIISKLAFALKKRSELERDTIITLSSEYLDIVKSNAIDHALKSINFYFLHFLKNEFLTYLIGMNVEESLGSEIEDLKNHNKKVEGEIKNLQESKKIFDLYVKKV